MLQYAIMLTNAREVSDSIREGRLRSNLKSGWKNECRMIIKYFLHDKHLNNVHVMDDHICYARIEEN